MAKKSNIRVPRARTVARRFMLAKVDGDVFELLRQRGSVVEVSTLEDAEAAVRDQAENYDNHLEVVELVRAEKSQKVGIFTVIGDEGELMLNRQNAVVLFRSYYSAIHAAGPFGVGEFVRSQKKTN